MVMAQPAAKLLMLSSVSFSMIKQSSTQYQLEQLERENKTLKQENLELKAFAQSRQAKLARKIAKIYNTTLPKNSLRRKALRATYNKFNLKYNRQQKRIAQKITDLAQNYDRIIVIDSIPWDADMYQRPHHFAKEFAALGWFVIYLEGANILDGFRIINDNLVTISSINVLKYLPRRNNRFFMISNTIATPLSSLLDVKKYGFKIIYDYIDEFHEDISGNLSTQMETWRNLDKVDPVLYLVTADRLYKDLRQKVGNQANILIAKNAVNIDHFDFNQPSVKKAATPYDLRPILNQQQPIIGFYGALAPWIDYQLLNQIADSHPDWQLVFIGIDYGESLHKLKLASNVHFLGPKDYQLLPSYSRHFDCAIIPFKTGEIAKATSPVKLFEYMAMGLPTVCTKDLQECQGYEYVYISKDNQQFIDNITQAINDKQNRKARKKLLEQAKQNTWQQRTQSLVNQLLK